MLFRIPFKEGHGYEIALPVLEGRQSESLYWIALTWRDASESVADAPVDPAERFGIRFERLTKLGQKTRPLIEGFLIVPGLRAELPRNWWPSTALRSEAGFPVTFVDRQGENFGQLMRLTPDEAAGYDWSTADWQVVERAGRQGAAARYLHESGISAFVAKEGHAYLFRPFEGVGESDAWRLMLQSVQLER